MDTSSEKLKEIIEMVIETPDLVTKNFDEDLDDFFTDVHFSDITPTENEKIVSKTDQKTIRLERLLEVFPNLNTNNTFLEYYYDFLSQIPENWDKDGKVSEFSYFDAIWPTYSQMDQKQRAYYYYWRGQFRKENYLETDTGYLKLFVYELLTMSHLEDRDKIFDFYLNVLQQYGEDFKHLIPTLSSWLLDFMFHHHLESYISKLPVDLLYKSERLNNYLLSAQVSDSNLKLDLNLIETFSDYKISDSPLFQDNKKLYQNLLPKVLRLTDNYLRKKTGKGIFQTFLTGEKTTINYTLFPGAITPEAGRLIETDIFDFSNQPLKEFFTQLTRFFENQLRKHLHYRGRLRNISLDRELQNYLTTSIKRTLNVDKKPENRILFFSDLNESKIKNLRKQSDIVRKSLEVEETVIDEPEIYPTIKESPISKTEPLESVSLSIGEVSSIDEEIFSFLNALKPYQLKAIQIIYNGQDIEDQLKELADENISLPELIIDEINELSFEFLDNLFIENDEIPSITDDYLDIVEELKLNEK